MPCSDTLSVVLVTIVLYFVCCCDAVKLGWMITRTVPTILPTATIFQTQADNQSMSKFVFLIYIYFYSLNNVVAVKHQFSSIHHFLKSAGYFLSFLLPSIFNEK